MHPEIDFPVKAKLPNFPHKTKNDFILKVCVSLTPSSDYTPFTANQCHVQRIKESEQRENKQVRIEVSFSRCLAVEHDIIYFPVLVNSSRRHSCPPSPSHPSIQDHPPRPRHRRYLSPTPPAQCLSHSTLVHQYFLSFAAFLSSDLLIFFRRPVGHKLHQ